MYEGSQRCDLKGQEKFLEQVSDGEAWRLREFGFAT